MAARQELLAQYVTLINNVLELSPMKCRSFLNA